MTAHIRHQKLILTDTHAAADSINYLTCRFHFTTPDWDGLDKWAHFEKDGEVLHIRLTDDRIRAQDGLNLTAGTWTVSLHGNAYENGEVVSRITTDRVALTVHPGGMTEGEPFSPLAPSAAEQIFARLDALEKNGAPSGGSSMIVSTAHTDTGTEADRDSREIIAHLQNGGTTVLADIDAGYLNFLTASGDEVLYGAMIAADDGASVIYTVRVCGRTVTPFLSLITPEEYARADEVYRREELEGAFGAIAEELADRYTKEEINAVMGSYIEDIAHLIGG